MRYIGESRFYDDIDGKWSEIFVEEYATIWSISVKHFGWALCSIQDWRYSKKEFKTVFQALNQFKKETNNRLNNNL